MSNYKERLLFYLGAEKDKPHPNMNELSIDDLTHFVHTHDHVYDTALKNLLVKTNNADKRFSFCRGDVITKYQQNNWSLSKNRSEGNTSSILLRSFNKNRHWNLYYNKPSDVSFDKKNNILFWRGTTTGCSQHYDAKYWNPRKVNRFIMIEKWFNTNPNIDVGFSFIHRDWLKNKYNKYVKGSVKPQEFLKNKYILSIEGNDKDSGLSWKLNSNSLVLMPKPRVTSWLMECKLIENEHYLLIKDDFSDLEDKINWCHKNQKRCKEIINNANQFMEQFSNDKEEEKLEIDVLNKYFELKRNCTNE